MPETASASLIDERIQSARKVLETAFLYRKLGVCFDYACDPKQFPPNTLPSAKEARDGTPNPSGAGAGACQSTRNGALLFDGYLMRLELGIAHPDEDRVFDRLIGGLIRMGTVASKGLIARGLTPDGRGYYPAIDLDSHLFWAYSAWRAHQTGAIAPDSQEKIENIVSRWIGRLRKDNWALAQAGNKAGDAVPLTDDEPYCRLVHLALLAIAFQVTGHAEWAEVYSELAAESNGKWLSTSLDGLDRLDRLPLQLALGILSAYETDEARKTLIRARQGELVAGAVPDLTAIDELKLEILEETPDLDWRALPAEEAAVLGGKRNDPALGLPTAWRRLQHESDTVRAAIEAGLVLLLTGDKEMVAPHAAALRHVIDATPWENLWLASALAPVISYHARGAEMGLWDEGLVETTPSIPAGSILDVKAFLDPNYDEEHAQAAGHVKSPPKRALVEPSKDDSSDGSKSKKGRGRRRRRRKRR